MSPSIAEQPKEAEEIVKPTSKLGAYYKLVYYVASSSVVVVGNVSDAPVRDHMVDHPPPPLLLIRPNRLITRQ
jgi:hypothetical protein